MSLGNGVLDEAYERLHRTGPEFGGFLSNHGPMAAEALVRMGRPRQVHAWVDAYLERLDEPPRGIEPIGPQDWRDALGDASRTGDWLAYLAGEVAGAPWREVLGAWWPRLLPGIAAGATHGVIRTGHAVRALLEEETAPRVAELGQALGYWAARWQPVPPLQLADTRSWAAAAVSAMTAADDDARLPGALGAVADAAVARYVRRGHGNGIMMVHAVTAPSAVLLALPALPLTQWRPSLVGAWSATAAVDAAYAASADAQRPARAPLDPDDAVEVAVRHGDEHVIKLTEAALRAYARGAGDVALAAVGTAAELIER